MIVFLFILLLKALPIANQYLQGTLHKYSLYARDRLYIDESLIVYSINNPSIVFYSDHKVITIRDKNDVMGLMKNGRRAIIITKAKDIDVFENMGFNLLEKDERYAILERK